MLIRPHRVAVASIFGLVALGAALAQTSVPHTFTAGEVISASEMNENFEAVAGAIDAVVEDAETFAQGYEIVALRSDFDSSTERTVGVQCPDGMVATGGGGSIFPSLADDARDSAPIALTSSAPTAGGDGVPNRWFVRAIEMAPYDFEWHLTAHVICRSR